MSLPCSYDYIKQKPGRKNSSVQTTVKRQGTKSLTVPRSYAIALKASQEATDSSTSPSTSPTKSGVSGAAYWNTSIRNGAHEVGGPSNPRSAPSHTTHFSPYPKIDTSLRSTGATYDSSMSYDQSPIAPSISGDKLASLLGDLQDTNGFGQHAGTSTPGRPWSSFAFSPRTRIQPTFDDSLKVPNNEDLSGLDWLDSMLEGTVAGSLGTSNNVAPELAFGSLDLTQFMSDQAHLLAQESPENMAMSVSSRGEKLSRGMHSKREPQLEDVTSWANISHFISLFLQYLYPLEPLVHRPTFAENLATRRDLRDTDFRALLLSIGKWS